MMNDYEKEKKKAEREVKKRNAIIVNAFKEVAQTESGKTVIWEILSMCGLYSTTFTGNSQGAFLEGKRSIGLDLLCILADMDKTFYPNLVLQRQGKDKK